MPPDAGPSQRGLVSSVFGFLSRELDNFVTNATGAGDTAQTHEAGPSTVVQSHGAINGTLRKRRTQEKRVDQIAVRNDGGDWMKEGLHQRERRRPRDGPYDSPRDRRKSRGRRSPSPSSSAPSREVSPSPAPRVLSHTQPLNSVLAQESEPSRQPQELRSSHHRPQAPSSPPSHLPPALRRRPSFTMPGSLFPRSPSLEPDLDYAEEGARHVRFASGIASPPVKHLDKSTPSSHEETGPFVQGPETPSSHNNSPMSPSNLTSISRSRSGDTAVGPPPYNGFASESPDRRTLSSVPTNRDEGKNTAEVSADQLYISPISTSLPHHDSAVLSKDVDLIWASEPQSADSSGLIRVRGKEQELFAAIEEQREKERRWGSEQPESMEARAERVLYEQKIKLLEEEVQRLKAELAKRNTSGIPQFAIPPAPPPPPLLTPNLTLNGFTTSGPQDTGALFASVRAGLKHKPLPVEAPINPVVYGSHRTKRTGLPTVNVPTDRMPAFLNEMKTAKLRKVADGRPPDLPPLTSSIGSGIIGGAGDTEYGGDEARTGEKRKRASMNGAEDIQAIKRRLTLASRSGPSRRDDMPPPDDFLSRSFSGRTAHQMQIPSRHQPEPTPGPSALSQLHSHANGQWWPARSNSRLGSGSGDTATEMTTPSLTSDNDVEGDAEDRILRTPPHNNIIDLDPQDLGPPIQLDFSKGKGKQRVLDDEVASFSLYESRQHDTNIISLRQRQCTPPSYAKVPFPDPIPASRSPSPEAELELPILNSDSHPHTSQTRPAQSIFDKRPPKSPLPAKACDTPRKPRPPGRIPRATSIPSKPNHSSQPPAEPKNNQAEEVDDDDDPSALSQAAARWNDLSGWSPPLPVKNLPPQSRIPVFLKSTSRKGPQRVPITSDHPVPAPRKSISLTSLRASTSLRSSMGAPAKGDSGQPSVHDEHRQLADPPAASPRRTHKERRRTLDEELRTAEIDLGQGREDRQNDDLHLSDLEGPAVLEGLGSKSKKAGYLAHGGAGGKPVFMGVGYVEGALAVEDEHHDGYRQEDDDEPWDALDDIEIGVGEANDLDSGWTRNLNMGVGKYRRN